MNVASGDRLVVRNWQFQLIGVVSSLLAAGAVTLAWVVITSPSYDEFDHPDGFTAGGRIFATIGCVIAILAFGVYGVAALRVVLIVDANGLLIRNPYRTTRVGWAAKPRFETRTRRQDASVISPNAVGAPRRAGRITYRFREITCITRDDNVWISATSRIRSDARVEELLRELRAAADRFRDERVSQDR